MTTDIDTATQELRDEHFRCECDKCAEHPLCDKCEDPWPCPTIRVLDRNEELEREHSILVEWFRHHDISEGQWGDLNNDSTATTAVRVMRERKLALAELEGRDRYEQLA